MVAQVLYLSWLLSGWSFKCRPIQRILQLLVNVKEEQDMTIVLTGGGSGGHITPILAVAHELKRLRPDIQLVYIGQRGDSLGDIPAQDPHIDQVYVVRADRKSVV